MPNFLSILRDRHQTTTRQKEQPLTQGVVIGYEAGQVKVVAGTYTFFCHSGIAESLKPGDRVHLVLGRGTPRIIGILGKDQNSP